MTQLKKNKEIRKEMAKFLELTLNKVRKVEEELKTTKYRQKAIIDMLNCGRVKYNSGESMHNFVWVSENSYDERKEATEYKFECTECKCFFTVPVSVPLFFKDESKMHEVTQTTSVEAFLRGEEE